VFPLGSISKSLTAAVAVQALADNGLDIDSPLADVVGWDVATFTDGTIPPDVNYSEIGVVTVRDLLQHHAGFTGPGTPGFSTYYIPLTQQADLAAIAASADARRLPLNLLSLKTWMLGVMTGGIDLPIDPVTMRERAIWNDGFQPLIYAYSNESYSILGMVADELAPSGLMGTLQDYAAIAGAATSMYPLNDTRLPRRGDYHAISHRRSRQLGASNSPYATGTPVAFTNENVISAPGVQVSEWSRLAVPLVPAMTHGQTYSAGQSMRGQTMGAGGVEASTEDTAKLFRALVVSGPGGVLDASVALALRTKDPGEPPNLIAGQCSWCDG
jgi:CubicO group peptidase (beta-lactamase class C family)